MNKDYPRPEYPRPQFRRERWSCLNGSWEFAFDDSASADWQARDLPDWPKKPSRKGRIMVPFPYQSKLSGLGERGVHPVVWYRREFRVKESWQGLRTLLHFGAVDYKSDYWLNGKHIGSHEGGYTPISLDVTYELADGNNQLTVRCEDLPSDEQPCGKQDRESHQP